METAEIFDVVERNGDIVLTTESLKPGDLVLHWPSGEVYEFSHFSQNSAKLDVRKDLLVCKRPYQAFPIREMRRVISYKTLWDHLSERT